MLLRKFAIVGLALGLIGLISAAATSFTSSDDSAAALPRGVVLDESTGLAPVEDVVAFFQRRAIERPDDYLTHTQLARAQATLARHRADLDAYAAAEHAARTALELKGDHQPAQLELAGALAAQHQFEASRELAEAVLADAPTSREAAAMVAEADLATGAYERAGEGFRRLAAEERTAPIVSSLARLASDLGDNEGAVALAAEALELSRALTQRPNDAAFYHFQLGHFRFQGGDVEGAIEAYQQALTVDPDHVGATEQLASAHAAVGQLDQAAVHYRTLIAGGPAADLHGSYAEVLHLLGDLDGAAEQERLGLGLAAETMEQHSAERRHLAGFLFSRDPEAALALARADLAERRDAGAHDTLAWALYQVGRYDEADRAMAEVVAIGTDTATVNYHAGAIAAAVGDDERALRHLRAALELNPTFGLGDADHARSLVDELTMTAGR